MGFSFKKIFWGAAFWTIVGGVFGARLYHVIDQFALYKDNLALALQFWHGGLGIYGAIIGGLIAATLYLNKHNQPLWTWLDAAAVALPFGQAIGRWANYFNQELFGKPTDLFWGIYIEFSKRPLQYAFYDRFHPVFIYESLLCLALGVLLVFAIKNKKTKPGTTFALYLAGYGAIRFMLEYLKIDPWQINGLNIAQLVSVFFMLASSVLIKRLGANKNA
jgi:phosphatidylglycerol:prolipoprotein diacylglycerol transferase